MSVKIYNTAHAAPTPALNAVATLVLVASLRVVSPGYFLWEQFTRGKAVSGGLGAFTGGAQPKGRRLRAMRQYLLKYFVMYAVLASVFAVVSAVIRFPSTIGILIPGLLAALIGQGYVRDHLQQPTNRERREFAAVAAALTAALGVLLLLVATALVRQALSSDSDAPSFLDPGRFAALGAVLFVLNFATIYIGVGMGARSALNRIAHPEAFPPSRDQAFEERDGGRRGSRAAGD